MPAYLLAGPAVALIGIVAIVFVMRHRSTEERSMYSSRRSQIQRKVQAARSRTLAPRGRSGKAPTEAEIAATQVGAQPAYQAPVAPKQAWEMPATATAYVAPPAEPPPAYTPPAYTPPAQPAEPMPAPAPTFEPAPAAPATEEPAWTPAPAEPAWNPAATSAPAPAPAEPISAPQPVSTPAGGGASWEIVGDVAPGQLEEQDRGKGKDKEKEKDKNKGKDRQKERAAAAAGGTAAWSLASGDAAIEPGAEDEGEMVRVPNPAMAIAQYAVLVVGLVMVLIGVLVMVANSKVT